MEITWKGQAKRPDSCRYKCKYFCEFSIVSRRKKKWTRMT